MKFFEKHHIKITLTLMITIISASFAVGVSITETRNKIDNSLLLLDQSIVHLSNDYNDNKSKTTLSINNLESENVLVKVEFAKIKTELAAIKYLLMEIKKDIRRKK